MQLPGMLSGVANPFSIKDFSAGLHADLHATTIPDGAASQCRNVVFDRRSVRTRPGRARHSLFPSAGGIRSLGKWEAQDTAGYLRLIAASGNKLTATDTASQLFTSHIHLDTTVHATNRIRFAQLGKWVYFADGDGWGKRACFDVGDPDAVETLDTFNMEAVPVLNPSAIGGVDLLVEGTYQFALCRMTDAGTHYQEIGQAVSVDVPWNTYRAITVTIPDVAAWADWHAGTDHINVLMKTPYNDEPYKWEDRWGSGGIDPSDPTPYYQPGVGAAVTFYAGTPYTPATHSVTAQQRVSNVVRFTAAGHAFQIGQMVSLTGGVYAGDCFVISAVDTNWFGTPSPGVDDAAPIGIAATATEMLPSQLDAAWSPAAPALEDFIPGPPKGATLVGVWGGRVFWVAREPWETVGAANTVYLGNLLEPTEVPWGTIIDAPSDYGMPFTVGADGEEITGWGCVGSVLALFSRRAMWMVDGEGFGSYRCLPVSGTHGCISHESIADCEGHLIWFGGDTVFGFDGSEPKDLADERIRTLLEGYTDAQKALSFAVYDRAKRWYVLFIPDGRAGPAGVSISDAYCLDLRTGAWAEWGEQPGGCALYAAKAATPGVYGSESVLPAGVDFYLCRLFEGEDDEGAAIESDWWSKEFEIPEPGHYKRILAVRAQAKCARPGEVLMRLAIRANESPYDSENSTDLDPLPGAGVPRLLRWRCPPIADVGTYRVGMHWSGTAALEVSRLDVEAAAKGVIR